MTADQQSSPERKVKTLAIRLDPELHAQLSVIAQIRGNSLTDEIREALSAHLATQVARPDLADSATSLLDDIEREAAARREALSTLLGSADASPKAPRRNGSGKRSAT